MRVRSGFVQKTNEQDIGKPESSVTFNDADLSDQPCKTMLFLFSLQMQIRGLLKVLFLHFKLKHLVEAWPFFKQKNNKT